jgi:hypothetical protein
VACLKNNKKMWVTNKCVTNKKGNKQGSIIQKGNYSGVGGRKEKYMG